jgi:hypothetical protein
MTPSRRSFLTTAASGLGAAALGSLLAGDGVLGDERASGFLAPRPPHFSAKAKACIYIFLAGGTSHIDLFDPKPKLTELSGQAIPESFTKGLKFAFTDPAKSYLMASKFPFRRYGQCGLELSELLPHVGSCADDLGLVRSMHHNVFAHAQAELESLTGKDLTGRPSAGAWVVYGLGSETQNLPAYVVLMTGRSPTARSLAWGNGFLPSHYQGVPLRNQGEPILNLANPEGVAAEMRREQLEAIAKLNRQKYEQTRDPEILSKIASYELAFRMQSTAPELIDLAGESAKTLEAYGVNRGGDDGDFGRNCLLARRMVERGVRFVSLFHRKWDQHKNLNEDYPNLCREIDQPIGALLKDLKARGLLDSTLVVWGTEFGRTALTENSKPGPGVGRDHHPFAFSQWLAGGGVRGGTVVGKTDELGWNPVEDPVHVNDFHATLLHLFGLDHLKLTYRFKGLDFRLTDQAGKVVQKLL